MTLYSSDAEKEFKHNIIEIGRRLWNRGYIAANYGNITVRMTNNEILTTPSGVSKGFMNPEMILKISAEGNIISENKYYKPFSEVKLHLQIYKYRKDVNAIIHSYPPHCTGLASSGMSLKKDLLPDASGLQGPLPVIPYEMSSTLELAEAAKNKIDKGDAVILANHGVLTFGADLMSAYYKLETLEHTAYITFIAEQLGKSFQAEKHKND